MESLGHDPMPGPNGHPQLNHITLEKQEAQRGGGPAGPHGTHTWPPCCVWGSVSLVSLSPWAQCSGQGRKRPRAHQDWDRARQGHLEGPCLLWAPSRQAGAGGRWASEGLDGGHTHLPGAGLGLAVAAQPPRQPLLRTAGMPCPRPSPSPRAPSLAHPLQGQPQQVPGLCTQPLRPLGSGPWKTAVPGQLTAPNGPGGARVGLRSGSVAPHSPRVGTPTTRQPGGGAGRLACTGSGGLVLPTLPRRTWMGSVPAGPDALPPSARPTGSFRCFPRSHPPPEAPYTLAWGQVALLGPLKFTVGSPSRAGVTKASGEPQVTPYRAFPWAPWPLAGMMLRTWAFGSCWWAGQGAEPWTPCPPQEQLLIPRMPSCRLWSPPCKGPWAGLQLECPRPVSNMSLGRGRGSSVPGPLPGPAPAQGSS